MPENGVKEKQGTKVVVEESSCDKLGESIDSNDIDIMT